MDEILLNSNKMTLSDSEFHRKFVNKYGKCGQQRSIFPTLLFYRITGTKKSVFRKEITFQTTFNKIQLNINFHEQNINSAPIFQNIRYYKNIIHNVLLNYSPIEEKLILTTSTRSNTGGNISKAPLINFNKVKSGNEDSTSFLPVTSYFFNSHFLDNTLLNTSASIPKSTPYFLEKSVIFGSIKKSSFMDLFWNPSTRILNNYPLNLHVMNKKFLSPDSSFNTYSIKSKPAFGKLLKLISSVHPRFLNNYPILIDSSRKADFECLKTLKPITPKGPEAENLLSDTFLKLALYSNWTYFSSHLKNLHGNDLKISKSLWTPDFSYKNSKLSHHFLAVDFPAKLDSHKKSNQPKIGLFDVFSLESKKSAFTKILARIFQMDAEYNSGYLLMKTFLRCKTSFSGQKASLIKIRNIDNEGLPDINHPLEIAYFNRFLNIHDIYAHDCNMNSTVNPGSILRNFHKICYSENSSFLKTLLNPRSYDVNPVFRKFRKPSPGIHTEFDKYIFDKGYSEETFKSENYSSSKRGSSIKYIFKIPSYKKDSDFIRNWLNSISLKNLIKLSANFHGIEASKKPGYLIETPFKADNLKKLIYDEYVSTLIPFKQSSLFSKYFIGLVYLKKDLFNASTSEDSSDGSFFVKNLHNTDCSRNLTSAFKEILSINSHTMGSSEKNPPLINSYLSNYYSTNLSQVFRNSLKTILQKSPNFANVFDIDSSRYLVNGNYFRHFPESLKRTNIFQNNIRFRLVKKIESNPEQRKAPSPGKEVHNTGKMSTGKVREIYSYEAKKLLSPGFLHVFQAGLRYENTKLLKMKTSISRNRNLTNIIDGYLEGYFQNKKNKLSFIGNPYSKKIETEDADYLQNKRNKLSFTENLHCNTFSKLALYSNWTYFSSHLKNLHGKGLKIPKSLWAPDFSYKSSKLFQSSKLFPHFLAVDFPAKLDSHKQFNQPKIGLFDVFSLESKNSASTKILARIFQMNAEYNSEHLLMEAFLRCKTSFSGQKASLIKIRNIDNEGLPDINHPLEIAYSNYFLNIHNIYAQGCNINSPVNPGSILRNFHKICYSENSSFLNTLLNPRSHDVNPVFRRFQKTSPGIHTELVKYIFDKGYSEETFKSENYSSSKRGSSIKYIFKIPGYKKDSDFIQNWLNSISLKNLIKLSANFHGIEASKKPGYLIETPFKADNLKKLIYDEYVSTLIPFKQSNLFSKYFIGLVYLKKDLFNVNTSEDSSDGSFFVKNLHNTDCSRNLPSTFKEILSINSHTMGSSEKNPPLINSYLSNYYSTNLSQVFRKSLKTILQKSPNFANVFDIDSSRYLVNGNYFRHFPESLKRTNIFQNNIRFRLVKKIKSNPEQRKVPSPGKEVHNTGKMSTGKVREIYSYEAKKLLSPGFLHVFQAGLQYENTKLLKMKTSISKNRNLTNIIDGYLEGHFQNKRNKLSFIGNSYSKKIFMDNPRDSKAKLPSFLSSFRYSTNNYSTKNMIPLKRKNLLLKTGPLYKISQIIASRNCNLILKHQAISGAGDSNLMFVMTKCKAENFFLESGELFGFKSADGIDYFQYENNLPVGNENLVYRSQENEITQSIAEEVKKIKKVVFDTQEAIVVNSSKDTFLNNTNLKQKIDIEYISEKVCQLMGHKMKIEAERRGIL